MLNFKQGDIFEQSVEAIVNPVNCVGVMGKGLALEFKNRFPDCYREYAQACRAGNVQPGRMFVFQTLLVRWPRYIINFPTKRHWRDQSRLQDIQDGLQALANEMQNRRITSVAIPALGAGLGGLEWEPVREAIESSMKGLEGVEITVLEPQARTEANRNPGRRSGNR